MTETRQSLCHDSTDKILHRHLKYSSRNPLTSMDAKLDLLHNFQNSKNARRIYKRHTAPSCLKCGHTSLYEETFIVVCFIFLEV